jgi:hypothetical protein
MNAELKVKCERNSAKYGVKRFAASLELSQVKAQQAVSDYDETRCKRCEAIYRQPSRLVQAKA